MTADFNSHMLAATILVTGRVQGVGFRWWAQDAARQLGLTGSAKNLPDGRVELRIQGETEALHRMIGLTIEQPTRGSRPGRVDDFEIRWREVEPGQAGFRCY